MEVEAPMPRARVRIATQVKPGDLRSIRAAKRKSCHEVSTIDSQLEERTTSLEISRLPRSRRTERSASFRLIPCFTFSSAAMSRKPRNSSSNSFSTRFFRNSDRSPVAMFRRRAIESLVPQSHDGVDAHGAAGGEVTRQNGNAD